LSLGDSGFGTDLFDPLRFGQVLRTPGYNHPDWADLAIELLQADADRLAAAVIEPVVQGASGMFIAEPGDVGRFGRACQEMGVLLVCDEVATGFGRTGRIFASELCGLRPDVLCLGKGLAGGYLPMSSTVASGAVAEAFLGEDLGARTLYHGHSFGGNALAAAVALRHLQLFAEMHVLDNVAARSEQIAKRLAELRGNPYVADVRARGLMAGVELAPPEPGLRWGHRVCGAAVERGVLLRPLGDVIVLMPMLTSTAPEIDRIVDTLQVAIGEVCG
ncbi:MAG TPA: aminotransferase class III-fold pyridoxal phosphate-dependent enzyme, partial [Acidimicrobiales bacterium]|nr:aminotransferase class III-fold pyridoxal phosphate-dependent enzyme [Acidimicrobiales bacterium]